MYSKIPDYTKHIIKIYYSTDVAILSSVKVSPAVMLLNDDCLCVSQILSINDKFIYFVISAFAGKYVIPLIHNHRCVEYIYVYTLDNEAKPEWLSLYPKIRGSWNVMQDLEKQLNMDISSNLKQRAFQSITWNSLLSQICLQNLNEELLIQISMKDEPEILLEPVIIATLQCSDLAISHPNQKSVLIQNFDDMTQCMDFILRETRSVFLIVSVTCIPLFDFQRFSRFDKLQAIYVWSKSLTTSISFFQSSVIHGMFTEVDELLKCLAEDICFFRQIKLRSFSFVTFKSIDMSQRISSQSNDEQNKFLRVYLLSKILSQMPEIVNHPVCSAEDSLQNIKYIMRLINTCRLSASLPDLLYIQRHITNSYKEQFVYPQVVYHADTVSTENLLILRQSCNQIFSNSTYIWATKSLMSARTVSRRIANTGLNAVLYEIETTQRTELFDFHIENYLLFPMGSTFRICSIDQAPDGVWYVKLNYTIEQDLEIIIQQLQYEVEQPLNWLTFGHFLQYLNFVDEAKEYYNSWLRILNVDHPDICSIHHHLGILHAVNKEDSKAIEHMTTVLQLSRPINNETISHKSPSSKAEGSYTLPINQGVIFGNIADMYDKLREHAKALEFYEKALAITTDQRCRRQFHLPTLFQMYKTTTINSLAPNYRKSSDQMQQKGRNKNCIGIWFHDKNFPSVDMQETMVTYLKATFEYIQVFDDIYQFTLYLLGDQLVANAVVIISSVLHGPSMCELVGNQAEKEKNKLRNLYVLLFEQTDKLFKQPVFTSIAELFSRIGSDIECPLQHFLSTGSEVAAAQTIDESKESNFLPPLGVIKFPIKQCSIRHLSNESLRFIQFQSLVEILLSMKHDEKQAKDDMLSHCRVYYQNNRVELCKIEDFKDKYTAENAVFYYTKDSFCFRTVNMAFRSEDIEHIFVYRLFITDLHKQLASRAVEKQKEKKDVTVYRGKKLPNTILQQLKDNICGLISMNGFLSTTKNQDAAKAFSGDDVMRDDHASVVFELHIQNLSSYKGQPFADISPDENEMDYEQEVLFSVGTVWRIENVRKDGHLWYIKLTNCSDLHDDLRELITSLNSGYTFLSIGNLLEQLGENEKAENFYRRMLRNEQNVTNEEKGLLYFHIGSLRASREDYFGALDNFNNAIPYFCSPTVTSEKASSSTVLITNANTSNYRLAIYYNIGMIHRRNKNWAEAQEAWEHALKAEGSPEELAKVHDCLGDLAHVCGNYGEAAKYRKDAADLIIQSSAREEDKHELKRKFDEATKLSDPISGILTSKRQRIERDNEETS